MHASRTLFFVVVLSTLFSLACGPTSDPYAPDKNEWDDVAVALKCNPNDEKQNCIEPRENTVRIDDEDRLKVASATWDAATNELTVTLKPGASLDPRIKVGTILHRARKDRLPLLHRVETLEKNGQVVKAKLARVSAKEAFKRGRIRARIPVTTGAMQQPLTSGVTKQPLEIAIGPADCSGNVFDKQVVSPAARGTVKLDLTKCKFRIMAWVDAIIEWDDGIANLDRLELSVGGGVEAAMHAQLIVDLDALYGEQKRLWEGPEIPISVGGIPVTINPSLFAGFSLTARAQLTVTHGFDMTDTINVGFGWSDRLGWYSIDERDTRFTEFGPNVTFDGNVKARAWVEPRLDIKAFGFVGATVTLRTFGEATMTSTAMSSGGNYSGQLCTSLDLGLTPTVGAVAEIFGVQLFQESVDLATFTTSIVRNKCAPMNGPIPPNCDLTSECCIDGQCPPPTEPGTTVKCGRGMPTSGGKYNFTCKTVYPPRYCTSDSQCQDLSIETVDSCRDYSCAHDLRGPDVAAAGTATAMTGTLCIAPACCHAKSDCADGNPNTVNKCVKPANSGPDVAGTCG